MIRSIIGALLFLTVPYKVFSQKSTADTVQPIQSLRFNVFGLVDPTDQNVSFGFEHRFRPDWSAGTDAGWIFHSNYTQKIKGVNGFILRPFLRYYPAGGWCFWEAELHYKYASYKIEDWLGRIPVNNIPAYEEFTTFRLKKRAAGLHLKWGFQANLSRDKKFRLEFVSGIGIRFKTHKVRDGIYTRLGGEIGINRIRAENYTGFVAPINLRLVYVIK